MWRAFNVLGKSLEMLGIQTRKESWNLRKKQPTLNSDDSNKPYDETDFWKTYDVKEFLIKNNTHETLVVYPESMDSCGVFESVQQQYQEMYMFKLYLYRDTSPREGIATAFTVQKGQKTYLMTCTEDGTLRLEERTAPQFISGYESKYIFYKRDFNEGDTEAYSFESSLFAGYFLASEQENGWKKLALRSRQHEVDENFRIQLVKI
ncbi:interleukin-18 isoform X2 [Microcaecilia unicolor]|uniref:Interleukin-18-like isoform X2 n=1 Tax=Microcaecilia unicolor TaxID=1415580 RepID=A0A6P7ZDF4_9AMPH|nr:interleukin-18-like isoform X2 [Microcaecilia unicolor]